MYQLIVANIQMKAVRSAPDGRGSGAAPSTSTPHVPINGPGEDDEDGDGDDPDSDRPRAGWDGTGPLHLYIDIETVPSQDPILQSEIALKHTVDMPDYDAIRPAANLKDPEKIAADIERRRAQAKLDFEAATKKVEEARDAEWRKTALDGTHGHIVCASFAFRDETVKNVSILPHTFRRDGIPELYPTVVDAAETGVVEDLFEEIELEMKRLAQQDAEAEWNTMEAQADSAGFYPITDDGAYVSKLPSDPEKWIGDRAATLAKRTPILVAHHAPFDIRFIWQRAIVLGVEIPDWWPIDARPWDTDRVQDTMTLWAGHGNRISLDRLCRTLGIPGKGDGIDGSKVWDAISVGRLEDVCSYCDDDVRRLRSVHRRLMGLAPLHKDIVQREEEAA